MKQPASPISFFNQLSSFFTPPKETPQIKKEPFTDPKPILTAETYDQALSLYLDNELNAYMNGAHLCSVCKSCWPAHKKMAVKLMKLHPYTYEPLTEED